MSEENMNVGCFVCDDFHFSHADRWEALRAELGYQRIAKYFDLREAALGGCKICSIVYEGVEAFRVVLGQLGVETCVYLRCRSLHPLEVGVKEHERAGARWLEFFTLAGQPALWTAFGPANLVPEKLDVEMATRQTKHWLSDCNTSHGCSGNRGRIRGLPTRVLDLGENPMPQDPIRLFETGGSKGIYMTLSHCWGPSQLITTTQETIKERIAGIDLEDLTKTFQDAVSLTRNLGIRYLWIDSLCIIQLDKADWEIEASKMGSVYSQSYLNIAATSSTEGSGGCFKERSTSLHDVPSPLTVGSHKIARPYLGSNYIYARLLLRPGHSDLDRKGSSWFSRFSPLISRAWVYQERILAPRTVHFHGTEMLWECISSSRCECGSLDREKATSFRPDASGGVSGDIEEQWQAVVRQYSGLNLSHASDKLPALAGIAQKFQAELRCDYLAGLWGSHLLRSLPWMLADGHKAFRGLPYRAPTWSWASLDNLTSPTNAHQGVRVTYAFTQSIRQDHRLAIVDTCVRTQGKNQFGAVEEGGYIVLEAAFLIPCTAEIETQMTMIDKIESTLLLHFEGHEQEVRVEPDIAFTPLPIGMSAPPYDAKEIRWLVLGKDEKKHFGLLLVRLDGQKNLYERVGVAWIWSPSPKLQDEAEVAMFKIV